MIMKRLFVVGCLTAALLGCSQGSEPVEQKAADSAAPTVPEALGLSEVLDRMPADMQSRYGYRHPQATLEFFGIEPGMTVIEGLPGGGWYSKILIPYLGSNGKLIGVDYSLDMFPLFGMFSDEALEKKKTWVTDWTAEAEQWRGESSASVDAFVFGKMNAGFAGSADAALMIRALHNLNRFEDDGGFLSQALSDIFTALKPGGILGVVQHKAAEDMPDDWANGSNGYLKQSALIAAIEAAGFEFVDASDVNLNPADQPTTDDFVWRLPPTLATSRDNPELKAEMLAIGESSRMTLKFRKPEQ